MFVYNMDQPEKQLDKEDFHECVSKTCLAVLKKQFETFVYHQPPKDSFKYSSDYESYVSIFLIFLEYTQNDTQSFQSAFLEYQDGIEQRIDARAHHEKELWIKERDVKQVRENGKKLNKFEMHKQDTLIQKSKCSSSRENTNPEDGKISKDASEMDTNVAKDSHDKDNISDVQSSNNKMFESVVAHDHDKKHAAEKTKWIIKRLKKKENVLLMKEIKTYKERVWDLEKNSDQFINYKTGYEKLQDILENRFLVEKQNIEKVEKEKDVLRDQMLKAKKKSDLPPKKMPNESRFLKLFVNLDKEIKELGKLININLKMDKDDSFHYDNRVGIRRLFTQEVVLISDTLNECSNKIKQEITAKVQEMLEIFESIESESYVEIKNKEELERFSKESKDVDKFCNDVVDVKEKLSKRIVQLEKDFAKLEAQSIAFEIAL
ncbi:hypothetical protein Tco_0696557 [Tanacetum coccineum]